MERIIFTLMFLFLVVGCNYDETLNKVLPKEESAFAKNYLENLRNKNYSELKKPLSKDLLTPNIESNMSKAASYFPDGELLEVKAIGANTYTTDKKWQAKLSYQYRFNNGWAVAVIYLERAEGDLLVKGVNVRRMDQSLEQYYAFDFNNKTIIHYVFLLLGVLIPLLILYALILCVKTPTLKRKWLWIIFILVGIGAIHLNWTTNQVYLQFAIVQLFGVNMGAESPYAPFIITLSIPLGAIIFLMKRKTVLAKISKRKTSQLSLDEKQKLKASFVSDEGNDEIQYFGEIIKKIDKYHLLISEKRPGKTKTTFDKTFSSWDELDKYLLAETKFILSDFK